MAKDRFAANKARERVRQRRPPSSWGPNRNRELMTLEQRKTIKRLGLATDTDVGALEGMTYEDALDLIVWLDALPRAE